MVLEFSYLMGHSCEEIAADHAMPGQHGEDAHVPRTRESCVVRCLAWPAATRTLTASITGAMNHGDYRGPLGAHRECWELLPWMANESAAAKDVARVEAHLRDCAANARRSWTLQRQLRDAIRAEEAVVLAPQTSLQKLMQRIDTPQEEVDASSKSHVRSRLHRSRLPRPARRRHARAGSPIAAVLQGSGDRGTARRGMVAIAKRHCRRLAYITMSSGAPVARGPVIRVVFAGNIALDDMNRVLRSIDAQIIAGPSEAGVYTLGLSAISADNVECRRGAVAVCARDEPRDVCRVRRCRPRAVTRAAMKARAIGLIVPAPGARRLRDVAQAMPVEPLRWSDAPERYRHRDAAQ